MAQRWKSEDEIEKYFGMTEKELKLEDLKSKPPFAVIDQFKKYCPICLNSETSIRNINKISKYFSKISTQKVFLLLKSNPDKYYDIKTIILELGAIDLSDGDLQRKALSILVSLGYIKKEMIKYKNKKGKEREKHFFKYQDRIIPSCYNPEKDNHINNWSRRNTPTKDNKAGENGTKD